MQQKKILLKLILIIISIVCIVHTTVLAVTANISYEKNGGFFTYSPDTQYTQGSILDLPNNIQKAGYNFAGWYEDSSFTGDVITQIPADATGDKKFWAKWDQNPKSAAYKDVTGGMYHTFAISTDGTLVGWGLNNNGQIGCNSSQDDMELTIVKEDAKFKEASAGGFFSLALLEDGSLWAMGSNGVGQLGNGDTNNSQTPIRITNSENTKFKKISAGMAHSLAIDENGALWAWGLNDNGQLGNGTTTNSLTPVKIMSGTSFKEISAGGNYSLALTEDGTLYAWGANDNGQLGNGTTSSSQTPTVASNIKFKKIEASIGEGYSLAIGEDNKLYVWGVNTYGQLGTGNTTSLQTPTNIMSENIFKEISVGYNTSFAITDDGKLYAWGANGNGELGDGTITLKSTPTLIKEGMIKVAATWNHVVGIDESGTLYAWGANENKELGDGTNITKTVPIPITQKQGKFKIEHYKQKDALDGYELVEEDVETYVGIIGTDISAIPKRI